MRIRVVVVVVPRARMVMPSPATQGGSSSLTSCLMDRMRYKHDTFHHLTAALAIATAITDLATKG